MRQPQQARRHQLLLPRARLLSLALPVLAALLPAAHGGLFSRGAERGAGWQLAPSEAGAAALRLRGGHGGGCPCEGATKTMMWLYDEVDFTKTHSLNTLRNMGVTEALRPSCERENPSEGLVSDADQQVLLCIHFKQLVNLKEIAISARGAACPRVVRAFANREVADFDDAEQDQPTKEWTLKDGTSTTLSTEDDGAFRQIQSLTLFVQENHGADQTRIDWIGLKGECLNVNIGGIVQNAEYELRPGTSFNVPGLSSGGLSGQTGGACSK